MKILSYQNFIAAANRLIAEVGKLSENEDALELQRLEQCARTLTAQLKAIQELDAHNLRQQQAETGQKYTRYEDLPPLMPEDRDRLKQELIDLLAPRRIEDAEPQFEDLHKPPKI